MIELAHLLVSASVTAIPEAVEVDITGVEAGTAIHVADLSLPSGVEAVTDAETDVVKVAAETAVEAPEAETEAEAPAAAEAE